MWFSVARLRQIFAASIAYVTLLPVVHARDEVLCECSFIILSRSSCRGELGRMQQLGLGGVGDICVEKALFCQAQHRRII